MSSRRVFLLLTYSPQTSLQTSPPLLSYLLFTAALVSPDLHPSPYRPSSSYFCYCVLGACVRSSVCDWLSTTRPICLLPTSSCGHLFRDAPSVIDRVLLLDDSFDSAYWVDTIRLSMCLLYARTI